MTTTLTVLGGSAASIGTGQGCAGYLVSTAGANIVLDLGPGTLLELRKHTDFRTVDAVIISHLHVDHILDVIAMRFALAYNPVKPSARVPLWLPPDGIELLRRIGEAFDFESNASAFFTTVFDVQEYNPEGELVIGDCSIRFTPTVHWVPCWAMRVHPVDGGGDLFYTADTGPSAHLAGLAEGAHVVLSEATTPVSQKENQPFEARGHIAIDEAATLAANAGARILVATHMFEENDPAAAVGLAREFFAGDIVHAKPGTTVRWG